MIVHNVCHEHPSSLVSSRPLQIVRPAQPEALHTLYYFTMFVVQPSVKHTKTQKCVPLRRCINFYGLIIFLGGRGVPIMNTAFL